MAECVAHNPTPQATMHNPTPQATMHNPTPQATMHNITSPRTDDDAVETMIQVKGKTAPRVTPQDIADNIVSEHYFTAADGFRLHWLTEDHPSHDTRTNVYDIARNVNLRSYASTCAGIDTHASTPPALSLLTFCVLVLKNGFTVTGESACASPENFDAEIGRTIAKANAVQKIWPLMGYALKERLHARA